jgi:mRNA-degrading endonuclease RelE of RelBE toxin-antitoxin system
MTMTLIPRAPRARAPAAAAVLPATSKFGFHISAEVEKRMARWRASVRDEVRRRLAEIAASAGKTVRKVKAPERKEPPLRFYVYEGYRIAYQIDEEHRRVVVLDIELLPVA